MKFGIIKSKIEKLFVESYSNNKFKDQLFVFEELILKNKNLKKIYYLYDELSQNKGLDKSLAENYTNESVVIYENTINNVTKENWLELNEWLKPVVVTNNYSDIDNLFSDNITLLEEKIKSKHSVIESLQQSPKNLVESHELPLNDLVNVANKTISDYLKTLNESDQLKVKNILKETDDKLQLKYEILKENVLEKLTELKVNETDSEIITKIVETTEKIQSENFDKITYLKLRELDKDL
jgi:hypothetical protein